MQKYWKKGFAVILSAAMSLAALTGCGGTGNTDSTNSGQAPAGTQTEADASVNASADSASGDASTAEKSVIDFEAEPYEVVMEVLTLGQEHPDIPEIEQRINEIALEKINCTLKIHAIHIADHATKLSLAAAGGDKLDLVYTGTTTSLPTLVADGVLLPLTELAQTRAPEYLEKVGDLIEACKINGEIYTLPANLYPASGSALVYNKEMADELGIQMPERLTNGFEELEPVAEVLKENGVYLYTPGDGSMIASLSMGIPSDIRINDLGGDYNYGVVIGEDSAEIVNPYEQDYFADACKKVREWRDKGYIPSDSMTNGENAQDTFKIGKSFLQGITYAPQENVMNQNSYPFATDFSVLTDGGKITTFGVTQFAWGICITSEQPERAMDMLNLIYTDAEVANYLMYGIEGKNYVHESERIVKYPEGVDANSNGYITNFLRAGDVLDMYQWSPNTEEIFDEIKAFNENAEIDYLLGYTFDASSVSSQLAAVSNVVAEYRPSLVCGAVEDVDAAIAEFVAKLDEAGYNDILEENQRQLDAWIAENK